MWRVDSPQTRGAWLLPVRSHVGSVLRSAQLATQKAFLKVSFQPKPRSKQRQPRERRPLGLKHSGCRRGDQACVDRVAHHRIRTGVDGAMIRLAGDAPRPITAEMDSRPPGKTESEGRERRDQPPGGEQRRAKAAARSLRGRSAEIRGKSLSREGWNTPILRRAGASPQCAWTRARRPSRNKATGPRTPAPRSAARFPGRCISRTASDWAAPVTAWFSFVEDLRVAC